MHKSSYGKIEKEKISQTYSENANETSYNYISNALKSVKSNISQSINTSTQFDFIYDTNFFTQHLETFTSLSFISDGNKILSPTKIQMIPFFKTYRKDNLNEK